MIVGVGDLLAGLGWTIYNRWIVAGRTGQSLGKRVTKIKLVSEPTGQPIGAVNAFLRDLVHILDGIAYVGYLWPLWDDKRQTFADKIMRTVVVNAALTAARRGLATRSALLVVRTGRPARRVRPITAHSGHRRCIAASDQHDGDAALGQAPGSARLRRATRQDRRQRRVDGQTGAAAGARPSGRGAATPAASPAGHRPAAAGRHAGGVRSACRSGPVGWSWRCSSSLLGKCRTDVR